MDVNSQDKPYFSLNLETLRSLPNARFMIKIAL